MNLAVTHWSANPVVLVVCAVAVVAHLAGMRRPATAGGRTPRIGAHPGREAVAFYAGLAAVLIALVSPLGYWSQRYVWVRSLQDLLLAVAAPGLIVLGAPWLVVARGLWPRGRSGGAGPAAPESAPPAAATRRGGVPTRGPWAWKPGRASAWPAAVAVAFNVAWWGWHVPAAYDAGLRYPAVYAAEAVTYLGLGIAFWLQLIGSWPAQPRWPPLRRVALIAGTIASDTVLSMVLGFGPGVLYGAYRASGHRHLSVVADQQVGGAILWALIMPPLIVTAVSLLIRWLSNEESEALTAGFDRLLETPTSAWPSRPGLR